MIGGFLGAGKTTTIGKLAQLYIDSGKQVGIVTNDQATDLVDTHTLRNQGFRVGEVAGACFCCNFNELTATVEQLQEDQQPDVILAEPVGSCTDLVATVIQPLRQFHPNQFTVAPYGVILKPSHGRRILSGEPNAGFSPEAAYIFNKQLEEADFLIINRIDELSDEQIDELMKLLANRLPQTPVLKISAKSGIGMQQLLDTVNQSAEGNGDPFGTRILELDYDRYAQGEADLGWLNANLKITAAEPFVLDDLLLRIMERLKLAFEDKQVETAHLKIIGSGPGFYAVANLVDREAPVELSLASQAELESSDLIINARVAIDPDSLKYLVRTTVDAVCRQQQLRATFGDIQSFQPGRPVPTHRIAEVP